MHNILRLGRGKGIGVNLSAVAGKALSQLDFIPDPIRI